MQQYSTMRAVREISARLSRGVVALSLVAGAIACSQADNTPPVATITFTPSKSRVTLDGPVDLTYRFDVAANAAINGDYTVFVHVNNPDGQTLWTDDHKPTIPTSQWKPGQKIEYTRTRFVPVVPFTGEATVLIGLYKDNERLPLQGPGPVDKDSAVRAYKVGTLQFLPTADNIFLIKKSGWHPDETAPEDASNSWTWTQKSAVLSLRNPRADVLFYLEYDARPDLFPGQPQQVTVYSGDQVIKTFAADASSPTLLRIPIAAAQLGTGEMTDLRIDLDKTFVPAKLPAGGKDNRELGIRVYHTFVEGR